MSTDSNRRPGGTWAILFPLFLCLDLATCQNDTFKFTSTPTNFQGFWYPNPTSVSAHYCQETVTWVTSSTYAGCCAAATCPMVTDCRGGTLTRADGSRETCSYGNPPQCDTRTIFPSSPVGLGSISWLRIGCNGGDGWTAYTFYREIVPTAVTRTITADGTTITIGPSTPAKSSNTTSQNSEPGANPGQGVDSADSSRPTGTPPPGAGAAATGSPSKAWIAGAVIGPLAALAAVGFVFFWLGKRRGDGKMGAASAASSGGYAQPGADSPVLYDPGPEKHEMPVYYPGPGGYLPQGYSPPPPPVHELEPAEMLPQELAVK